MPATKNAGKPEWSEVTQNLQSSLDSINQLIDNWNDPIFVTIRYESSLIIKQFPVQFHLTSENPQNLLGFVNSRNLPDEASRYRALILCLLVASPKYISASTRILDLSKTACADYENQIPLLCSLDMKSTVFILTVVYLIRNGLNEKILERELDGMILHFINLENSDDYPQKSNLRMTTRSATLVTLYQSVLNATLNLCNLFHMPCMGIWNMIDGALFNFFQFGEDHVKNLENSGQEQQQQSVEGATPPEPAPEGKNEKFEKFENLKKLILSIVNVNDDGIKFKNLSDDVDVVAKPWDAVEKAICKHWENHGECRYGDKCRGSHPPELAKELRPASAETSYKKYDKPYQPRAPRGGDDQGYRGGYQGNRGDYGQQHQNELRLSGSRGSKPRTSSRGGDDQGSSHSLSNSGGRGGQSGGYNHHGGGYRRGSGSGEHYYRPESPTHGPILTQPDFMGMGVMHQSPPVAVPMGFAPAGVMPNGITFHVPPPPGAENWQQELVANPASAVQHQLSSSPVTPPHMGYPPQLWGYHHDQQAVVGYRGADGSLIPQGSPYSRGGGNFGRGGRGGYRGEGDRRGGQLYGVRGVPVDGQQPIPQPGRGGPYVPPQGGPPGQPVPCRYFQQGECKRGGACTFAHI